MRNQEGAPPWLMRLGALTGIHDHPHSQVYLGHILQPSGRKGGVGAGFWKIKSATDLTPWVPDSQIKHSMAIVPVCSFRVRSGTPATLVEP